MVANPVRSEVQPRLEALAPVTDLSGLELDGFAEAADRAQTPRAVRDLLVGAMRDGGIRQVAVLTHLDADVLGSLAVSAHNWSDAAYDHLQSWASLGRNPVFAYAERHPRGFAWSCAQFRQALNRRQTAWLDRFDVLGIANAVTQPIDGAMTPSTCTLSCAHLDLTAQRRAFRLARYAFHRIIALQRPALPDVDLLTHREQQCLELAALTGLAPRAIAGRMGVSLNSVRTTRRRAFQRLGGGTLEECIWRAIETGQLFRAGRIGKPRAG